MKNVLKIKTLAILALIAFFGLTSCSNSDDPIVIPTPTPTPVDNTIAGKAIATPDLSILVAALSKTNLVATLQGTGPFTVFAPTNAAFGLANISVASINASTPAQVDALKQILLNHVVSGSTTAAQLTNDSYLRTLGLGAASTTKTLSMLVKKTTNGGGTTVKLNNNATVTTPDISASNGIIHIVDRVIVAPTIIDLAATNGDFSSLAGALTTAGLITTLQGAGPFTVFAPVNAAFTSLTTEIAPLVPNATQLGNILKYHVVSGNYLASDLPTVIAAGPTATLLTPQKFTISLTGGPNITGTYSPARMASKIVATDVQGNNGVIHVLDKVLLPATF
jgi:uncharacterized surface protein with fasciclin (FAS1) repeats